MTSAHLLQCPVTLNPHRFRDSFSELLSPGPYLELFGTEAWPGSNWTVFGNQVTEHYF